MFGVSDQSNIQQHVRDFNTHKNSVVVPKKNPFKRNTYVNFNSDSKSIEEEATEAIVEVLKKPKPGRPPLGIYVSDGTDIQLKLGHLKVVKRQQEKRKSV